MCVFELELNMLMGYSSAFLIGGGTAKVDVKTIAKVGNKYQGGYQGIQGNPPPKVHLMACLVELHLVAHLVVYLWGPLEWLAN
jgi:hypothetical protein